MYTLLQCTHFYFCAFTVYAQFLAVKAKLDMNHLKLRLKYFGKCWPSILNAMYLDNIGELGIKKSMPEKSLSATIGAHCIAVKGRRFK